MKTSILLTFFLCYFSAFAELQVGVGKEELRFPARGNRMMGYSEPSQIASGQLDQVYARAFYVYDSNSDKKFGILVLDTLSVSENIKSKILSQIEFLDDSNLMILATHTHSVPGGYDPFDLYNYAAGGFDPIVESAIINGGIDALRKAKMNSSKGSLKISQGKIQGVSYNRSLKAFKNNLDSSEQTLSVPETMTLLNFYQNNSLVGVLNFFAVHATSLRNSNKLISGDNKGIAAWFVEKELNVVAAFANSNAGDVSPNIKEIRKKKNYERAKFIGLKQAKKTLELLQVGNEEEVSDFDAFYVKVRMPGYEIRPESSGLKGSTFLCEPAVGISTLAGTEDGRGLPFKIGVREGMSHDNKKFFLGAWLTALLLPFELDAYKKKMNRPILTLRKTKLKNLKQIDPCQGQKLVIGKLKTEFGYGVPENLPFQAFRLGKFWLLGLPGEYTTTAGRRLQESVKEVLGLERRQDIILGGYANSFSSYITTREEYSLQHYEGASTLYGPYTASAQRQIFLDLVTGKNPNSVLLSKMGNQIPEPFKRKKKWKKKKASVKDYESLPAEELVIKRPKEIYEVSDKGREVRVSFHLEDPRFTNDSDPIVEIVNSRNEVIMDSNDPRIQLFYKSSKKKMKKVLIKWKLDHSVPDDTYRIRFNQSRRTETGSFQVVKV